MTQQLRRAADWCGSLPNPQGPRPPRPTERTDPLYADALRATLAHVQEDAR